MLVQFVVLSWTEREKQNPLAVALLLFRWSRTLVTTSAIPYGYELLGKEKQKRDTWPSCLGHFTPRIAREQIVNTLANNFAKPKRWLGFSCECLNRKLVVLYCRWFAGNFSYSGCALPLRSKSQLLLIKHRPTSLFLWQSKQNLLFLLLIDWSPC